jgi:hypothetical protein
MLFVSTHWQLLAHASSLQRLCSFLQGLRSLSTLTGLTQLTLRALVLKRGNCVDWVRLNLGWLPSSCLASMQLAGLMLDCPLRRGQQAAWWVPASWVACLQSPCHHPWPIVSRHLTMRAAAWLPYLGLLGP